MAPGSIRLNLGHPARRIEIDIVILQQRPQPALSLDLDTLNCRGFGLHYSTTQGCLWLYLAAVYDPYRVVVFRG